MDHKAVVQDGIMFRRVFKGDKQYTLVLEKNVDRSSDDLFAVNIETDAGMERGNASFQTISKAIEFFDYATHQIVADKEAQDKFDIGKAQQTFMHIH